MTLASFTYKVLIVSLGKLSQQNNFKSIVHCQQTNKHFSTHLYGSRRPFPSMPQIASCIRILVYIYIFQKHSKNTVSF